MRRRKSFIVYTTIQVKMSNNWLCSVVFEVSIEQGSASESEVANMARVGTFPSMHPDMYSKRRFLGETLRAV